MAGLAKVIIDQGGIGAALTEMMVGGVAEKYVGGVASK